MDDSEALRKLINDLNLEGISDVDELKDLCMSIDKYLETRVATVKNLEAEIFAKCIRMAESRSKLLYAVNGKMKAAECMIPYQDCNLRKYFMNRVFCFDSLSERVLEIDEFSLPAPLVDKFKGKLPTKLILKDSRGRVLEYVLIYSTKSFSIQEVYNLDNEKLELIPSDHQEISNLVAKLKSFVGENYCGTRKICIDDLESFLQDGSKDRWDRSANKSVNQSSFLFGEDD
jgi:hypothetical protein